MTSADTDRKPHETKKSNRFFGKILRKLSRSSSNALSLQQSRSNSTTVLSSANGAQRPRSRAYSNQLSLRTKDGDPYSRNLDGDMGSEVDLHDIMLDLSFRSSDREYTVSTPGTSEQSSLGNILSSIPPEAITMPKYIRSSRKNNKSPRVLNNLFLAQELRSASSQDCPSHGDQSDSDDSCEQPESTSAPMNPNEILVVEFSKDGKYLAAAGRDSRITVWQVISSPLSKLSYKSNSDAMKRHNSKKQKLKVYGAAPVFLPEPVRVFEGHKSSILCLDWSKNNFLLSGSMDKTVKLWNIDRPDCLETFQHQDFVTALKFHPTDDRFFVSGALDNNLRLWSILESSVAFTNDLGDNTLITALEFTPYGNYCVVGGFNGSMFVLETQGLHLVKRIELKAEFKALSTFSSHGCKVTGIKIFENPASVDVPSTNLDKWNILITTNDSTIRLVDLRHKKLVTRFRGNTNRSSSIVANMSEDCQYIISGSEDHYCYIWDNNNSIINNKLRLALKEMFLGGKNQLNEKHKKLSKLIQDNRLWKKIPVQLFLEDGEGKSYIANDNTSYSSFHAHHSRVNVALFAPEKTKRLLSFSDDSIFDLVKRNEALQRKGLVLLKSSRDHPGDHIIITTDTTGLIRVFRQDPAYSVRKRLIETRKYYRGDNSNKSNLDMELGGLNSLSYSSTDDFNAIRSLSPSGDSCRVRHRLHKNLRTPNEKSFIKNSASSENVLANLKTIVTPPPDDGELGYFPQVEFPSVQLRSRKIAFE